jgi:hypothetical protein
MLQLLAQIPGTDQAIASAAREGWVAVLLVVIVLATFTTFGLVIKQILNEASARESRLSERLTELEDFIRSDLLVALRENTQAIQQMNVIILHCQESVKQVIN